MPKHYRPAGKKKEGNAAKYITRTKAVKYLQISLAVFRKLCILKGVFPREPKKKVEGNHKTYYHMKDIAFLAHDPLIEKFRLAICGYLIAAHENPGLSVCMIDNIDLWLSHEWQAYISRTNSLRKTFISVKGIYYQAEVQGQKITWLTPHALQQVLTDDVDFNVMLTFLEFYETLLGFVNFKLYHSINVNYPPILDPRLEALAAELYALSRYMSSGRLPGNPESNGLIEDKETENNKESSKTDESELRLAQLQHQLPANEPGALMHLVEESTADDTEEESVKECRTLFKDLKFYLSREVPRESLLFIIPAFGGTVSWEGEGAPFDETDQDITHQIVDRPTQSHVFLSRHYVQPQWIFDCVNILKVIPTDDYIVGRVPPPHISPFVDNDKEGHIPDYAVTLEGYKSAGQNQVMPLPGLGDEDLGNSIVEAKSEHNEFAKKKKELEMQEKKYHEELKMEIEGTTFSNLSNKKADSAADVADEDEAQAAIDQAEKDADDIAKSVVSRRKRGLIEAMQISNDRKKSKVELLKQRKKAAESSASAKAKRR
uniref:Pescadillo N domain-containing protein n=1 Tax=Triticum aestivum TaxID=4565 RepID=I3NM43_WHEAT|nr:pescadillo N domain-containing protein [Triticum aestivum]